MRMLRSSRTAMQLVRRAVEALLTSGQHKVGGGGGNVLCYGFRRKRPTGKQLVRPSLSATSMRMQCC
jgi:hypothetical protein